MRPPYELPLDFLSFRNFAFNLTLSYKPSADVFVPYNYWQWDEGEAPEERDRGRSPRVAAAGDMRAAEAAAAAAAVANKTRKVLWLIDGPCKVNIKRGKKIVRYEKYDCVISFFLFQ